MPFLVTRTERGMSRHEGVSCDACLRSNFRGRRYKCLICYDYDLCAGCHEAGSTTTRHAADHPMQCILTRSDAEVLYGGEALPLEQPRSFVCPHCGRMGFTETSLADHVSTQHADSVTQVVCPVCASVPSGEPNHVTEDLPTHLTVDHHRGGGGGGVGGLSARDLISFGDEPAPAGRQSARRVPHPAQAGGAPRIRRFNTHFRESMDPITELLSQLSGVRRAATLVSGGPSVGAIGSGTASRLQQLQAVRQRGERPARRQPAVVSGGAADSGVAAAPATEAAAAPRRPDAGGATSGAGASADGPQFLLASILDEDDSDRAGRQMSRADRSAFVQEVILSTLIDSMESTSISEPGGRPALAAAAAASAPTSAASSQPSSQKARDAGRPAAGAPARVTPPTAGAPAGAGAAARPAGVPSRLPSARPGRGAAQLRASGLVHHPAGVMTGVRGGQRKPPRPAAAAPAADGRPAEPSAH